MALKLKRAYQIDKNKPEVQELTQLGTDISVSAMMITTAKKELTDDLNRRNELLRDILLNEYSYILTSNDKVLYMDQTSEIRVYESNGTIQKETNQRF